MPLLAFGQPGPTELLIVLAIVLLLFGAKKLPGLSRSLGRSLSEFKKGREEGLSSGADPVKPLDAKEDKTLVESESSDTSTSS